MMPALSSKIDPTRLFARFARLRFRLRMVAVLQGVFAVAAILVGGAALEGWIDWKWHLPGLVRAIALVSILGTAGYAFVRWLLVPLRTPVDNLRLALQLEARHPELYDVLASAVQFLQRSSTDEERDSPLLRKVAVREALKAADGLNFGDLLSLRGLQLAVLGIVMAMGISLPPALLRPVPISIALTRLLAPFGVAAWPAKTTITITSPNRWPHRLALGDGLEVKAELHGTIPERATLSVWFEGAPPVDQIWLITPGPSPNQANLTVRVEAGRISRDFRFKIKANDADGGWLDVSVKPPPQLEPLDKRPSPQIHLGYPRYTDLPPKQLPDGGSSFEMIAGTSVHLRAGVNRPVARSYLVYSPESPIQNTAAALAPLAAASPLDTVSATAGGQSVWTAIPVNLSGDGRVLDVTFMPRVAGIYALRFEDETGFGSTRLLEIRVIPDPAPVISLDRPSAGRDSLAVTPTAELPLESKVTDTLFAVKSVWLEYRTAKGDPNRRRTQFDHRTAGELIPQLLSPGSPPMRLRWQSVQIDGRLAIASFRHPDGSHLKDGDTLVIQMTADDFDDIAFTKEPGRSHELELKIVSPANLDVLLNKDQSVIRQNLLRLQQLQKEAREKVDAAKDHRQADGDKLRPEDLEKLIQAEQLQQQVRGRIGDEKEGLRAEVNRIRQARQDNKLPASASQDRMDAVATELDRLAREELEPIEPLLNAARESANAPDAPKPNDPNKPDPLAEASKHQKEVERTLSHLLERLEPWSGANELRGETRATLTEQEAIQKQTEALADQKQSGENKQKLTEQEQKELDSLAAKQAGLAAQMKELVEKIDRVATEKRKDAAQRDAQANELEEQAAERERLSEQETDAARKAQLKREADRLKTEAQQQKETAAAERKEADALKDAAKTGNEGVMPEDKETTAPPAKLSDAAQKAAENIGKNQLGEAKKNQKQAGKTMKQMLDSLEENRKDDLDRLAKKIREAEKRLDDFADQQERLQKKVKDAQNIPNPMERRQALEKLARDQDRLKDEARDLAAELSRLKAKDAAESLQKAAREMADAAQRLERGEKPDQSQDDALQKLDDAQNELEKDREKVEEELLREQLAKITDRIKSLRDRQDGAIKDAKRVHSSAIRAKKWETPLLESLLDVADAEDNLAKELDGLNEQRFKKMKVIAKLVELSTDAMKQASKRIHDRNEVIKERDPFDPAAEEKDQAEIIKLQEVALKRLDQFLDAIKPDKEMVKAANDEKKDKKDDDPPMGGGGGGGGDGDNIPQLAQLRALRMLQAEVNANTERFAKDHPDTTKLTEVEKTELETLRKTQGDIADLIREFSPADEPKGGQQ